MIELVDFDILVAVKKAAPKVTQVPFDRAQMAAQALLLIASAEEPNKDIDGQKYWSAPLKDLVAVVGLGSGAVTSRQFGTAYRMMGLSGWRQMDGFYVAWSEPQLKLLKKYFKL